MRLVTTGKWENAVVAAVHTDRRTSCPRLWCRSRRHTCCCHTRPSRWPCSPCTSCSTPDKLRQTHSQPLEQAVADGPARRAPHGAVLWAEVDAQCNKLQGQACRSNVDRCEYFQRMNEWTKVLPTSSKVDNTLQWSTCRGVIFQDQSLGQSSRGKCPYFGDT